MSYQNNLIMVFSSFIKGILVFPIKVYQVTISPFFPDSCKYYPTCSNYSIEAIQKYGAIRGLLKSVWRILRCNPFSKGGYDPVK